MKDTNVSTKKNEEPVFYLKWATDRKACFGAVTSFQDEFGKSAPMKDVISWLHRIEKFDWEAWLLGQDETETVKKFVECGANIHTCDDCALLWAAVNGHLETIKFLVSQGANIHTRDDIALCYAADGGHLEIVKFLVSKGANIYARNDQVFRWAAHNHHAEVVNFLRNQG